MEGNTVLLCKWLQVSTVIVVIVTINWTLKSVLEQRQRRVSQDFLQLHETQALLLVEALDAA